MKWFKNIFRKKISPSLTGEGRGEAPLSISGIPPAPLTPEPDDAELAAQAILETLASDSRVSSFKSKVSSKKKKTPETRNLNAEGVASDKRERSGKSETRDAEHFRELAEKIRNAREVSRSRTLRFICYCEQQLQQAELPEVGKNSLSLLETELYKRIDIVDHVGGDLKRRWQHCLAEVTVRRAKPHPDPTPVGEGKNLKPET